MISTGKVATIGILVAACILTKAPVVTAQNPPAGDLAVGYQFVSDSDLSAAGWFVTGADYVTDDMALVGEVTGSHSVSLYTYMGGVRFGGSGSVRPFVQFLAGVAHLARPHDSALNFFAVQPGGGVDVPLTNAIAMRFMVDYRRLIDEDAGHEIRVALGVAIGFGNR